MSKQQDDIELIERFFRQELTPDELRDFETRVKTDSEFVKELTGMRDLYYGIRQAARHDLKVELKDLEAEVMVQGVKPYYGGLKIWLKWFLGLLLAAILGYFVFTNWYRFSSFKIYTPESDSTTESMSPATPGGGQTFIKDASDSTFKGIPADLKLELSDTGVFEVIHMSAENGLYQYKIVTPQGDYLVNSPVADLDSQLFRRRRQSQNSVPKETARDTALIEGVDQ